MEKERLHFFMLSNCFSKKVPIFEWIKHKSWIKESVMNIAPLYSFCKLGFTTISLTILLLLLSMNLSFGQTLTCGITKQISCNGLSDGEITVTVTGGTAPFEYSDNGTNWSAPTTEPTYVFIVGDGSHTFHVRDNDSNQDNCTQIILQPDPLTFTLGGQDWTCPSPSCNGSITVSVTGGTAPYDTTVMLGAVEQYYPFTGLCEGTFTVSVVDANSCPATPLPTQDFTIALDITPPAGDCVWPPNQRYNIATEYPAAGIGAITTTFSAYTYDGNSVGNANNDSVTIGIDAANHSNVQVRIGARQAGESTAWGATDLLELSYTLELNGEFTVWTPFFVDNCRWEADPVPGCNPNEQPNLTTSAWIDVPAAAGNTIFIMIRVKSDDGAKDYSVEQFDVRGRSVYAALAPGYTGSPSGCTDVPAGGVTYPYTDQAIHWYCHNPAEFSFVRRWTAQDICGNTTLPHDQRISVGTPPNITEPNDTVFDFCNYLGVDISAPVNSDNCGTPVVTWSITSVGFNRNGIGDIVDLDFPIPTAEIAYTINWTVTDSILFTNSADQVVTFRAPIAITFTPAKFHFCSGESASFTIEPTGGTGSYITPLVPGDVINVGGVTISPNGSWSDPEVNGSGTFTTTNLTVGSPNIQVVYTDVTIEGTGGVAGGCSTQVQFTGDGTDFFVHDNIPTNPLQRIP